MKNTNNESGSEIITRPYLIDGQPCAARDLIAEAECLDSAFADDWLKTTSKAAQILRANGRIIENAPRES